MTGAGWRVRPGGPSDRELLASFACADSAVRWQGEVEQFIQAQLADWAFDPQAADGDPRLLLAFTAAGDLFGVAAHERVTLQASDGSRFPATKLEVVGQPHRLPPAQAHRGDESPHPDYRRIVTPQKGR
jgi:hypothetical protein